MPKIVTRPWWTPPEPSHPIGTLLPGNAESSKLEEQVRAKLTAAGIQLQEARLGVQCGFDEARNKYPVLTPDFLIPDDKVCIEIDPESTHSGREDQDRGRNELLAAAGWRVVRLRMGGLEAIGEGDVVSDSGGFTIAAAEALVEAVNDAVAGRTAVIRTVKRKTTTARKKSRLGAIREDEYQDRVHRVKWALDDGTILDLGIVDARYLARSRKWEFPRFVRQPDLQGAPKEDWRKILEPLFENMSAAEFEPVSTYPWGDSLFIGPQARNIRLRDKFNPFGPGEYLTTNRDGVVEYNTAIFQAAEGAVMAELHAEAVAIGWEIQSVQARTGRHGDYQEVVLVRNGFEA